MLDFQKALGWMQLHKLHTLHTQAHTQHPRECLGLRPISTMLAPPRGFIGRQLIDAPLRANSRSYCTHCT